MENRVITKNGKITVFCCYESKTKTICPFVNAEHFVCALGGCGGVACGVDSVPTECPLLN